MSSRRERIDQAQLAADEFEGAVLGDARRSARLMEVAHALAKRPGESLPKALGDESALEATYRFLGNEAVTPEAILGPHQARTQERCAGTDRILAVFDTTELLFSGEREGLGYLSHEKSRGLRCHIGLAVSADGRREPLGVLHCETLNRPVAKKRRRSTVGTLESEAWRWHRGVEAVQTVCPQAVCVMDRESDIYTLVEQMLEAEQTFVIRSAHNRVTNSGHVREGLSKTRLFGRREIELGERRATKRRSGSGRFPERKPRSAIVELRAQRVTLIAPANLKTESEAMFADEIDMGPSRRAVAPTVALHLIHVIEPEPPQGEEPVEWLLLTNLPIASKADVDFIVDAYRARWLVEEFFKALKSGCAIEKRQLESVRSVRNMLAVSLPIAWLILRLRSLSRHEPDRIATDLLSPLMLSCLRVLYTKRRKRQLPAQPTCRELTWAIAGLGGHITNNGEPGHIVLGRGLADLIFATDVAAALGFPSQM